MGSAWWCNVHHLEKWWSESQWGWDDIPYMENSWKFQKCLKPPARFSHPSLWFTKAGMARHFSVKSAPWAVTRMLTSRRKGKGREDRLSWGSVVGQFGLPEFCFESLTVFLSQLGWLFLIYGKLNMFQTTNQLVILELKDFLCLTGLPEVLAINT